MPLKRKASEIISDRRGHLTIKVTAHAFSPNSLCGLYFPYSLSDSKLSLFSRLKKTLLLLMWRGCGGMTWHVTYIYISAATGFVHQSTWKVTKLFNFFNYCGCAWKVKLSVTSCTQNCDCSVVCFYFISKHLFLRILVLIWLWSGYGSFRLLILLGVKDRELMFCFCQSIVHGWSSRTLPNMLSFNLVKGKQVSQPCWRERREGEEGGGCVWGSGDSFPISHCQPAPPPVGWEPATSRAESLSRDFTENPIMDEAGKHST